MKPKFEQREDITNLGALALIARAIEFISMVVSYILSLII